jgi:hypothetical protein
MLAPIIANYTLKLGLLGTFGRSRKREHFFSKLTNTYRHLPICKVPTRQIPKLEAPQHHHELNDELNGNYTDQIVAIGMYSDFGTVILIGSSLLSILHCPKFIYQLVLCA